MIIKSSADTQSTTPLLIQSTPLIEVDPAEPRVVRELRPVVKVETPDSCNTPEGQIKVPSTIISPARVLTPDSVTVLDNGAIKGKKFALIVESVNEMESGVARFSAPDNVALVKLIASVGSTVALIMSKIEVEVTLIEPEPVKELPGCIFRSLPSCRINDEPNATSKLPKLIKL